MTMSFAFLKNIMLRLTTNWLRPLLACRSFSSNNNSSSSSSSSNNNNNNNNSNNKSTAAVRPEHQLDAKALQDYLAAKSVVPFQVESLVIEQFSHGQSNPTYLVVAQGKDNNNKAEYVLRKKPPGKLLPTAHDVGREYRVISALRDSKVPVPKAVLHCVDASILGTEWYLTDFVKGRIFQEPWLPAMSPEERSQIYDSMIQVMANMHTLDYNKAGLGDFGKIGGYAARQVDRWGNQFEASKTHEIAEMDYLKSYLKSNIPSGDSTALVHGDFRMDNLIYEANGAKVLATLDWELATLGDPLCDLSYTCMIYHLESDFPALKGLKGNNEAGIPNEKQLVDRYCALTGKKVDDELWSFYLAFSFFRAAAILQGVYKRALQGNASSAKAKQVGAMATKIAEIGKIASQPKGRRSYSTSASTSHMYGFMSPRAQELYKKVKDFVDWEVIPSEGDLWAHALNAETKWTIHPRMEELKLKAKQQGLWNLWIPKELDRKGELGGGLSNLEYAVICEEMGRSPYGPEPFNCGAPDTGNMEVLLRCGSEEQKKEWLRPLLDGSIRSGFAMTEPKVASSDATNIQGRIDREGNEYVLNGLKWWTSGACDPRCKMLLYMGKTDPTCDKHKQQSIIIVPSSAKGVKIVRPLMVFGYDDAPHGHAEVSFDNVRVPISNLVWGEGRGFEIAQKRLGPGRIHHCMRLIGLAQRSLEAMKARVKSRVAFGKPLSTQGTIMHDIALSRLDIEQARLLTLRAAELMDLHGAKGAMEHIAMIKIAAPSMALRVTDRAIQAHGAAGVSQDFPLAYAWAMARTLRIADGPDEVHIRTLGKLQLNNSN